MSWNPYNSRRYYSDDDLEEDDPYKDETFAERQARLDKWRADRIKSIVERYECSLDDANRYMDYRDEGYPAYQAAVMAGLADPHE